MGATAGSWYGAPICEAYYFSDGSILLYNYKNTNSVTSIYPFFLFVFKIVKIKEKLCYNLSDLIRYRYRKRCRTIGADLGIEVYMSRSGILVRNEQKLDVFSGDQGDRVDAAEKQKNR